MCDFFRIYNIRARHASDALVYIFVAYFFFCSKFSFIELATSKSDKHQTIYPFHPVTSPEFFSVHCFAFDAFPYPDVLWGLHLNLNSQITSDKKSWRRKRGSLFSSKLNSVIFCLCSSKMFPLKMNLSYGKNWMSGKSAFINYDKKEIRKIWTFLHDTLRIYYPVWQQRKVLPFNHVASLHTSYVIMVDGCRFLLFFAFKPFRLKFFHSVHARNIE